ncbi:MAG: lipid-A-disaccharide synthase [Legionella sp. 21-45-4]|nr:MAG: lipid-A-disaccharide synthase [Legionella sp. 21-45-4]
MLSLKHLVFIAGEESGDEHAAHLVNELRQKQPNLRFSGIGGHHLESAGVTLVSDLARFGLTGLLHVLRHLPALRQAFQALKVHLRDNPPDLVILIDYPGFNLRLAKYIKLHYPNTPIIYYISPQIWAWKAKRIEIIRRYVDHMAVIFPFEETLYHNEQIPATFVGHPLVARIEAFKQNPPTRDSLHLPPHKRIIALLPGSRLHEIQHHLPLLCQTAIRLSAQWDDLHFVIPVAKSLSGDAVKRYWSHNAPDCTFLTGHALEAVYCSDHVIVASGTASLECALLAKSMCIIYKSSLLNYLVASQVIRVRYLSLCNLLSNRMIVPELLQYDCTVTELTKVMTQLLIDTSFSHKIQRNLQAMRLNLSTQKASMALSRLIETTLKLPGFDS